MQTISRDIVQEVTQLKDLVRFEIVDARRLVIRVPENLSKSDRIMEIYSSKISDAPKILFEVLEEQKKRLEKARIEYGDYIKPYEFQ